MSLGFTLVVGWGVVALVVLAILQLAWSVETARNTRRIRELLEVAAMPQPLRFNDAKLSEGEVAELVAKLRALSRRPVDAPAPAGDPS